MESYKIHNTSRAVHTRFIRTISPGKAKMKQHVGGGELRILRSRPLVVSEEVLARHLEEIKAKQKVGALEVRTLDGRLVNLEDMSVGAGEPKVATPVPQMDSAKNDKNLNIGEQLPQFPGGIPMGAVPAGTDATGAGIPGPLESEDPVDHSDPPAEETEEDVPADATVTSGKKKKGHR